MEGEINFIMNKNQNPIWIVSDDKSLIDWASRPFGKERAVIKVDYQRIPTRPSPALILIGCDYQCRCHVCARRFQVPPLFSDVPSVIARPLLMKNMRSNLGEYLISNFSDPPSNQELDKIGELRQLELLQRSLKYSHDPALRIIRLQQQIVESRGKAAKVSLLAKQTGLSISRLSTSFKQATGLPLKSFLNKVRICYCLWELVCSEIPIKHIALDVGYRPASFSLKFHQALGMWPSEARRLNRYLINS
jgi:AraC-like DNA-binding protein